LTFHNPPAAPSITIARQTITYTLIEGNDVKFLWQILDTFHTRHLASWLSDISDFSIRENIPLTFVYCKNLFVIVFPYNISEMYCRYSIYFIEDNDYSFQIKYQKFNNLKVFI
jgi:hypothetical protein